MKKIITLIICLFISSFTFSQEKNEFEKKYEMKTYYMVFLKKGPNRNQDSTTTAKLQEQHMAHLTKMAETGKMDLAGPFTDNGEIRGICVYNVATKEEAEKLANEDPIVKAGRLIVEIHPWYAAKDSKLK
jgi:uncharacterized protein YciI